MLDKLLSVGAVSQNQKEEIGLNKKPTLDTGATKNSVNLTDRIEKLKNELKAALETANRPQRLEEEIKVVKKVRDQHLSKVESLEAKITKKSDSNKKVTEELVSSRKQIERFVQQAKVISIEKNSSFLPNVQLP